MCQAVRFALSSSSSRLPQYQDKLCDALHAILRDSVLTQLTLQTMQLSGDFVLLPHVDEVNLHLYERAMLTQSHLPACSAKQFCKNNALHFRAHGHQLGLSQWCDLVRRRKFNTSIEPAVAYENESVFMSGPVQQWPAIVHRHPLGPCAKPKTSWHQMHPETAPHV